MKLLELSTPQRQQRRIALDTLRMSEFGARIMGGMNHEEARAFLLSIGYTAAAIAKLEAA